MVTATIKQNGEVTHVKKDCADVYHARRWASVQGKQGFDFVAMGGSRTFFIDYDRNATLELN